ncbi:MAG: AbrB/MazE/SpoVT family DNA-binding domain-containing protein [Gammaproteobacteria bacterium]|nr:AbrB/MazE/SpoVT family DNA-binding domain-containing protein [Gammaproteobacteria bacterium]
MLIKVTAKRQVTFPAHVLDTLGVMAGDQLELQPSVDGFILRPRKIDPGRLAPLRNQLRRGRGHFDIEVFREQTHDPKLRD